MLVLPSIVSVLPMTAQEVSAAGEVSLYWNYNFNTSSESIVQIEKGEKFNIGDYAYIWAGDNNYGCASQYKNVKYSSSKKSVLAINSKGIVTAKKTGKATITIKYKGKKITKKFQVVKTGTFDDTVAVKGIRQKAEKLSKSMPSKITLSNGYKYLKMVKDYRTFIKNNPNEISEAGILLEEIQTGTYSYFGNSGKLAVPQAGRFFVLDQMLYKYADKNSPTSTTCSKRLKIDSASASTKSIKVKTKQKVTGAHVLAAHILNQSHNEATGKTTANAVISVYDKTADKSYIGIATIKKGSKTVTIKIGEYTYNPDIRGSEFTYAKLKKGHKYVIGTKGYSWGDGKTVKVK